MTDESQWWKWDGIMTTKIDMLVVLSHCPVVYIIMRWEVAPCLPGSDLCSLCWPPSSSLPPARTVPSEIQIQTSAGHLLPWTSDRPGLHLPRLVVGWGVGGLLVVSRAGRRWWWWWWRWDHQHDLQPLWCGQTVMIVTIHSGQQQQVTRQTCSSHSHSGNVSTTIVWRHSASHLLSNY